jgi:protoheme ferro-lyase
MTTEYPIQAGRIYDVPLGGLYNGEPDTWTLRWRVSEFVAQVPTVIIARDFVFDANVKFLLTNTMHPTLGRNYKLDIWTLDPLTGETEQTQEYLQRAVGSQFETVSFISTNLYEPPIFGGGGGGRG